MRLKIVVALLLARPLAAQKTDTVSKTLFTRRDAVVAVGVIAGSVVMAHYDLKIEKWFRDTSLAHVRAGQRYDTLFSNLNEITLTLGGVAAYGVGRLFKAQALTDIAFHTTEAIFTSDVFVQAVRAPLARSRPWVTNYTNQYDFDWFRGFIDYKDRSFPSMHAATGFAAATALTMETHLRHPDAVKFVAPILYALALTPGLSRMYLEQHWASDVFAGAAVGTFAGIKAVGYSHAHPGGRLQKALLPLNVSGANGRLNVGWATGY